MGYRPKCALWDNSGMAVRGAFLLDLRPRPQDRTHIWYYKSGQNLVAGEIIGLHSKATAVVLFSGCDVLVKLPSRHLYYVSQIVVAVILEQENIFFFFTVDSNYRKDSWVELLKN